MSYSRRKAPQGRLPHLPPHVGTLESVASLLYLIIERMKERSRAREDSRLSAIIGDSMGSVNQCQAISGFGEARLFRKAEAGG
jgi:hypothetical protein